MQCVCSPYENNNNFPCPASEDKSVDIIYTSYSDDWLTYSGRRLPLRSAWSSETQSRGLSQGSKGERWYKWEIGETRAGIWEADTARGIKYGTKWRGGGVHWYLETDMGVWECRGLWGADCGMEVAGPGAGPWEETIANGHRGNSTGHESADHMLIGGLVAECLILKALRSSTHAARFLAVQISILAGKSSKTNFLPRASSLC